MENLIKCCILSDGEGELYLVPFDKKESFENIQEQINTCEDGEDEYNLYDKFTNAYERYKIEGGLSDIIFYTDKENKNE